MKRQFVCLMLALIGCIAYTNSRAGEITSMDALPGDGVLRFYRLAIPVTQSAYEYDLGSSYDKVLVFWQECEDFVNKVFVPLGFCFDVVEDERLVDLPDLPINIYNGLPEIGNGTILLDGIIGSSNYDVGMWVVHRNEFEENSGLSAVNGAYSASTKASGYAKTDKWVVAHELGHMSGAVHTPQGEGSLMDNIGEFFSYPSIKTIRNRAKNTASYKNIAVENNAPQFDTEKMKDSYRIPQGAFFAIDVCATDKENHKLMYTAIGCNSSNVDKVQDSWDGVMPSFPSFVPQESNVISYSPIYTADIFYDDFFYLKDGTAIHEMEPGTYDLSILVNDVPNTAFSYEALQVSPFYSTYAIWEAKVEIVAGTAFSASLSPQKTSYTAGEDIQVRWEVNKNYFTKDSRLRITMSTDYGKTFKFVLADGVSALDGQCSVKLPGVNVGQVEVDFTTAKRMMNGGIIKIEEVDGVAFTLTSFDPMDGKSFIVTDGVDEDIDEDETTGAEQLTIDNSQLTIYDLQGRRVKTPDKGLYIINGKKVIK